jgi:PhnB protein
MAVSPIPKDQDAAIPYLCIQNAASAIEFYQRAFGAKELMRIGMPGGTIGHAEMTIGNARIMIADEFPDYGFLAPPTVGGSPVTIHVYVEDIDSFAKKAVSEGLIELSPVQTQFYGDRSGKFRDPFGHIWSFATHVEDVPNDEVERRAAQMFGGA